MCSDLDGSQQMKGRETRGSFWRTLDQTPTRESREVSSHEHCWAARTFIYLCTALTAQQLDAFFTILPSFEKSECQLFKVISTIDIRTYNSQKMWFLSTCKHEVQPLRKPFVVQPHCSLTKQNITRIRRQNVFCIEDQFWVCASTPWVRYNVESTRRPWPCLRRWF